MMWQKVFFFFSVIEWVFTSIEVYSSLHYNTDETAEVECSKARNGVHADALVS